MIRAVNLVEMSPGAPPPARGARKSLIKSSSYDASAHTVEVVLSSGVDVRRYGYIERLLIDPKAIDLSRVASGAVKVLNSHNAGDVGAILGVLQSARIANGQLLGVIKFGETAAAQEAEGMVARGELSHVSIGYEVALWRAAEVITDPSTGAEVTIWRADEWALLETSFVSVPADPTAGVRSASPVPVETALAEGETMLTRNQPAGTAPANTAPAVAGVTRFTTTEALDFVANGRSFGLESEARALVDQNTAGAISPETASSTLLRRAAERQNAAVAPALGGARAGDPSETSRAAIADAIAARALGKAPSDQAREFMGMRLLEIAIARTPGMNPRERDSSRILRAANTTSDFPLILESAANKVLLDRYVAANPSYRAIAKQRDLRDFKPSKLLRIGDFPTLKEYAEDGEIQSGTINEGRETVTLASYGRILRLSRQAIVNDDLGAFGNLIGGIGQTVALFENSTFLAVKAANSGNGPKLSDNVNLFNSAHGNLAGSGTVIDVTNLGAARAAMRTQTNLDGKVLNIEAKTLFVGAAKETQAEQVTASITPHQPSDVNPFAGKLQVVAEGAISGNAWEIYADPNLWPVWHFGYLEEAPGPRVLTEESFSHDGMAWRVTLDFYAAAVDYRGAYRNPGA